VTQAAQHATPSPVVLESREGAVATITLNRPDRLNALNVELGSALLTALQNAAADPAVRVIVLTGAGRAFCAGGDVNMLRDARIRNAAPELAELVGAGKEIVLTIADAPKPVLACVNGPAAGGGMNLALACDLRIASESAVFAQSFAKLGLYPDFGGTWTLPRLAGPARAAELFYTGDLINARDAEQIGIVDHVVLQDRLVEETRILAGRLAAAPPIAARAVKRLLFGSSREELARALDAEIDQQIKCFQSEDCLEGLNAFFEKRPPRFRGQ
jgi:2-(1,2-epoxy-1,2-dihydrophenyl)acetyl-CoA isomerase